ncbi:hypothetical protein SLS60_000402 [Paraconiothyrium brasiliense]|uniref:Uncharacterized protein n=1 Tax=Paraconiothyrium brasiliense TaxID=300254 RepID=A0ABR3S6X9_9PLEO
MSTTSSINLTAAHGRHTARNPLIKGYISVDPLSTTVLSIPSAIALRHLFLVDRGDAAYIYLSDSITPPHEPVYVIPNGFLKRGAARTLAVGKVTSDRKGAKCIYTVTKTPPAITPQSITIEHRDIDGKPYAKESLLTKRALHKGLNMSFATSTSSHKWKVDERGIRDDVGKFIGKEIHSSRYPGFEGACELQLVTTIDDNEMDFLVAVWVARIGNGMGALDGKVDDISGNMFVQGEMMLFNYK